jgi:hypothetical protein
MIKSGPFAVLHVKMSVSFQPVCDCDTCSKALFTHRSLGGAAIDPFP